LISILPRQPRRVGTPHRVDPVHQLQTDLLKLDAVTEDRKRIRCEHADQQRAVPPISWPLQTRLRQPLNGGHRRQSLSPPSTICRMFMRMVLGPATGPPWPSVMLDLAPHRPDDAVHKTDFASVV
jgi:hypothetical protein